jgi:adhesin/invasin
MALPVLGLGLTVLLASCGEDSVTGPPADEASTARSVVSVSTASVEAGDSAVLSLETRNAAGTRIRSGGLTVRFHAVGGLTTGASAGTIGATKDHNDGTYTATFSATIAGTPLSIGATIDGDTVTTPRPALRVSPGPAAASTSELFLSTRHLDVGGTGVLKLVVRDAAGNQRQEGGGEVSFTATEGTSAGEIGATTDNQDGTYTATFTATAVGTAMTIRATLDGESVPMTDSLRVVAGPVSMAESELIVSTDTVTVGTVVQLLLRTKDAEGRDLVSGGREVVFDAAEGDGVSEGVIEADSVDLGDGTYTANFRATRAGTATTISATIDGTPVTSERTITVNNVQPSPQTSVVTVEADALAAGDSTALTLTVFDPDSTAVTTGGLKVVFVTVTADTAEASTGEIHYAADDGYATDHGNGTYTATFAARRAGAPVKLAAEMDNTPVQMLDSLGVSKLPAITVTPGSVSLDSSFVEVSDTQLALGDSALLLLRTRDDFANQLTKGDLTVAFTATADVLGGPVGDVGGVKDVGDGTYTAVYTATKEVTALISATIGGQPIASDSVPILAVCSTGVVSPAMSEVAVNDSVLSSGVGITVTLLARDADGHCLRNTGLAVVFGTEGGTSTGTLTPTVDQGDGSYSATLTGVLAGTPTTVTATIDDDSVTSALPEVRVQPGDVSGAASILTVDRDRLDVGGTSRIDLTAFDAAGNRIEDGGLAVEFFVSGGTSTGNLSFVTDNADGTYFTRFSATGVGSPLTVTAAIDGTGAGSTAQTIEVVAGRISADSSLATLMGGTTVGDTTTIAVGDTVTVTLNARDEQGRELVGGGRTVVFSATGGTSDAAFLSSPALDPDDGTYTSVLVGISAGTPVTIGATIDGTTVASPLPTLVVE